MIKKLYTGRWPIRLSAILLTSLLTGCGGGGSSAPVPASSGQPVTQQSAMVVGAYFGIFDTFIYDMAMLVKENIPWGKINRLYIAFATISSNGELVDYTNLADSITAAEAEKRTKNIVALCRTANPDAEILISTAPWMFVSDDNYLQALWNPQKFADSVLRYVKKYNLDGLDIDWESPVLRDDQAVIGQLPVFFSTCRKTLQAAGPNPHGKPYKVTTTVGYHSPQTISSLKDSIDGINIMSYGGPDAGGLIDVVTKYRDAGFPTEKMIGGITCEVENIPETESSVAAKWSYAHQQKMGGMFAWRMDNDTRLSLGSPPTFRLTNWLFGYSLAPP